MKLSNPKEKCSIIRVLIVVGGGLLCMFDYRQSIYCGERKCQTRYQDTVSKIIIVVIIEYSWHLCTYILRAIRIRAKNILTIFPNKIVFDLFLSGLKQNIQIDKQ